MSFVCIQNLDPLSLDTKYRQTSDINRTLLGSKIVDHADVIGAAPTVILWLQRDLTGLGKDN